MPTKPKTKPTVTKASPVVVPVVPVVKEAAKEKKGRDTVLFSITPAELAAKIGPDTPVQVGRKSLNAILKAKVLADAGL